ncbi:MAG: DnaJ domain-containing protein [Patescibacteria group bacterium]|nr:DnaJ domain-containing protein [Patescibacteria group bacterium]
MSDLYALLGVGKKASRDDIKKAYRDKAKKAHPDTGGAPEKFALVKHAYDVLMDEDRRDKYDQTGDDSDKNPDNEESQVINILGQAFESVLSSIEQRGGDPVEFDIISDMKILIGGKLAEIANTQRNMERNAAKYRRLVGKFKKKKGPNFLENMVEQKIKTIEKSLRDLEKQDAVGKKVLAVLKDYKFDFSPMQGAGNPFTRNSSFTMLDMMQAASGRF